MRLEQIDEFPDHPFQVGDDEEMADLAQSIREHGVLMPVLLRPKPDGRYEMVSGHRRSYAAERAGIDIVPVIVRELTDDEATILMVDSNLQREHILPSERAKAYKMKLEAMKRQGQRNDLTSSTNETKLRSDEILARQVGQSRSQIQKIIRPNELVQPLAEMVDDGKIAVSPAVELSYLSEEEQAALYETMQEEECTPSVKQAQKMKEFSQEGRLGPEVILSILSEEKPNQKEVIKLPREKLDGFFKAGTPAAEIERTIVAALKEYRARQQRREQMR